MTETERERARNIGLRAQGVQNFNAFIREGETRQEAMEAIARAAEVLRREIDGKPRG